MNTTQHKPAHRFLTPLRTARARAKAIDGNMYALRNLTSAAAVDIVEDLAELALELEMIALNMRHEIKLAADAGAR